MANTRVNLITGTAGGTPISSSPQRVWNMYPTVDAFNKTGVVWKNTPGWTVYVEINKGENRGLQEYNGELYGVFGSGLYKVTALGAAFVGTLNSSTTKVHMATDGITLAITDENNIYTYDGTTFTPLASLPTGAAVDGSQDLYSPTGIVFHDGHYVCYDKNTGRFWISNNFDGTTWTDLDFATAEDKPDNIVGLLSDRVLWVFGEYTTQAYYNSGEAFPFKPYPQGKLIYGMIGDTAVQMDNTAYWLARAKNGTLKVVRANGFVPKTVSTPQLEEEMATLSTTDDAYANTLMWEGHEWYVLTFPTANRTFVLDTQGAWFEWGEYDESTDSLVKHIMVSFIYFDGMYLFSNSQGTIYQLKANIYNHYDKTMVSGFRSSVVHVDEQRLFLYRLLMDMKVGNDEDGDAVMNLRWSTDGGYSWSSWVPRDLGAGGKTRTRVQWHGLGSGYNYVIEGRITDEAPRQIMSAVVDVGVQQSYLERRNERAGVAVNQYDTGQ